MEEATLPIPFRALCCFECGITWTVPAAFLVARQKFDRDIFCPSGHTNNYRNPLHVSADGEVTASPGRADILAIHEREQREARIADKLRERLVIRPPNDRGRTRCPCCRRTFDYLPALRSHLLDDHCCTSPEVDAAFSRYPNAA